MERSYGVSCKHAMTNACVTVRSVAMDEKVTLYVREYAHHRSLDNRFMLSMYELEPLPYSLNFHIVCDHVAAAANIAGIANTSSV